MAFCQQYGLPIPIVQALMAGSCPVSLAVAVADAFQLGLSPLIRNSSWVWGAVLVRKRPA
jgi:nitronate monooxygenase